MAQEAMIIRFPRKYHYIEVECSYKDCHASLKKRKKKYPLCMYEIYRIDKRLYYFCTSYCAAKTLKKMGIYYWGDPEKGLPYPMY